MPASRALETLLVCTCLAQSVLSNNVNDDFVCDKVEKKSPPFSRARSSHVQLVIMPSWRYAKLVKYFGILTKDA
jgi:hypothetical protein